MAFNITKLYFSRFCNSMTFVIYNKKTLFGVSACLPLRETVHGCWRQTGDKCDWLNGKGQPRPSEQLQHRLGATPWVWTQCSANTLTITFWHHCPLTKKCIFWLKKSFIYLFLLSCSVPSPLLALLCSLFTMKVPLRHSRLYFCENKRCSWSLRCFQSTWGFCN